MCWGGNGNQMPGKGTFRDRVICAERSGEIYRNWFHLHTAGRLGCALELMLSRKEGMDWAALRVPGPSQFLGGCVLTPPRPSPPPGFCFHLTFPSLSPPLRPRKVCGQLRFRL